MIIRIDIQCDQLGELTTHLYTIIKAIKKHAKKNGLSASGDIPADMDLDDNNCYGTHQVTITTE